MSATRQAEDGARPARRRLSVDRRREELIAAALELFSRHDAEDVSIDDVAASAGASRALVYHYFGGKQELYVAALRSAAAELQARLQAQGEGGPLEQLGAGLTRYFDFVEEHAAGFAALLRGGPANRTGEIGEIVDGVRQRMLRMIVHQMGVDAPGPALRVTLRSWVASVETAGLDWLEHRDMARAELERLLVDQMVALLRAASAQDPGVRVLLETLLPTHAASENAPRENAPRENAPLENAPLENAASDNRASEHPASGSSASGSSASEKASPKNVSPEKASPEKASPKNAPPKDLATENLAAESRAPGSPASVNREAVP